MSPVPSNLFASTERGSVFLLARWSGPSLMALHRLRLAWEAAGLADSELHILDWDEHPSLSELPELTGKVNGWGEAFHVRHGVITHFQVLGRAVNAIEDEIQRFINHSRND